MPRDRNLGYLLPDQLTGHPLRCVQINIPDVREYRIAFWGAVLQLARWWSWEKTGDKSGKIAADYWLEVLLPQYSAYLEGEGCGEGNECMLRQNPANPCELQQSLDNGATWLTVFNFADCAVPGPPGPQGEPGQPGADGDTIDTINVQTVSCDVPATAVYADGVLSLGIPRGCDGADGQDGLPGQPGAGIDSVTVATLECGTSATASLNNGVLALGIPRGCDGAAGGVSWPGPGQGETGSHSCAGSVGLADYIISLANTILDKRQLELDYRVAAWSIVEAIPVLGDGVSVIGDLAFNISQSEVDGLRVDLNAAPFREDFICDILYFTDPQQNGLGPGYTTTVHDLLLTPIKLPITSTVLARQTLKALGYGTANARYALYAQGTSTECAVCQPSGQWCYEADFSISQHGFSVEASRGNYAAGTGFVSIYNFAGLNNTEIRISRTVAATQFTKCEVVYYATTLPSQTDAYNFNATFAAGTGEVTAVIDDDITIEKLRFDLSKNTSGPGQQFIIRKLRFWGTGVNPFGSDNC